MLAEERSLCSLLSLPQLPLQAVIKCLSQEDRQSLAATCRQLATAVSAASPDTRLTVTPSTGWQGISKVLHTRTITCKTLRIKGRMASQYAPKGSHSCSTVPQEPVNASPDNAFDVLLGPKQVTGCSFPGITQVFLDTGPRVKQRPLRCVLPVNIASCLPDIEELEVKYTPGLLANSADLHPIPYCSSLRRISYIAAVCMGLPLYLPSKYHTAEDLRRQLPNIVSLTVLPYFVPAASRTQSENCIHRMLDAWGDQLTEVKLSQAPKQVQQCRCLHSLTLDGEWASPVVPFGALPPSITSLTLNSSIEESQLQVILQLPALRVLSVIAFMEPLKQDWSQHPCTWQQLKIISMEMEDLAKLPLHSLKGKGCLNITGLSLPDPYWPDALNKVMHAAQCVTNANITVEGFTDWKYRYGEEDEVYVDESDAILAEILHAASSAVQPPEFYHHSHMPLLPKTEQALFRWLSPTLCECRIIAFARTLPSEFWQALQCCSRLERVELEIKACHSLTQFMKRVITLVLPAAEHLVAVTHRPVMLVMHFMMWDNDSDKEAFLVATSKLQSLIQQRLPSTVSLQGYTWTDCDVTVSLKPVS